MAERYTTHPLTYEQFYGVWDAFQDWFRIRRVHDKRFQEMFPDQRAKGFDPITQLDADIWHSALLQRMLIHGKEPLPEPPPIASSYPVYDDLKSV